MLFASETNNKLNNVGLIVVIGILIVIALIIAFIFWYKSKRYKPSAINFISGAPKTGKSAVMLWLGLRDYFEVVISFYIRKFLVKELIYFTFHRVKKFIVAYDDLVKPILITNMPIRFIKFYPFTIDILYRTVRIPNKSIILLDETSLLADSMLFNDKKINAKLQTFYKLFGHYSHGGRIYANSQSPLDNHYALKRNVVRYLFVLHTSSFPFVAVSKVKELAFSEDGNQYQMNAQDLEKTGFLNLFFPKFLFKVYDCYYLSAFTDNLAYLDVKPLKLGKRDSLKVKAIVTLNNDIELKEIKENEKE